MRVLPRLLLCVFIAFVFAGLCHAQTATGVILGRVVDQSGAAVAGAEVKLTNQETNDVRRLTTQANGDFIFLDVHPGAFALSVTAGGFKTLAKANLNLSPSDRLSVGDLKLEVGTVAEKIDVTAEGAPVETATSERSSLIDSKQITQLMTVGRDAMALLQLLPGVVDDATGSDVLGQFQTPTAGGVRQYYNALNIDGISGNTARGRTAESPINLDAIQEIKVLTNSYPAEYGTAAGMVINLVTKSGTQHFHGGGYYYVRNEALNANDFFNNSASTYIPRQRYRYNTLGPNLGGPIYWPGHFNRDKQKLFFYFSAEYDPNQRPLSQRSFTVPTALERKGDFSQTWKSCKSYTDLSTCTLTIVKDPLTGQPFPNNIIPGERIDPNSAKLLSIFPLPNATNLPITKLSYNYQIAGTSDVPVNQEILKVDTNLSEKARLWVRASGFASHNKSLTSPAIQNQWGPATVDYAQTMPNIGGTFTYMLSPTMVNEATVGLNLWTERQELTAEGLKAYQRSTYGINIAQAHPDNNALGLLPAMSFGGVSKAAQISYDGRFPMVDDSTAWSFSDQLTKVRSTHQFKVGVLFQRVLYNQYHQAGGNSFPGSFNFGQTSNNPLDAGYAYANAVLGVFNTYNERTNRVDYAPVTRILEWFGQDTWRAARGLTIDVGLRFTLALPQSPNNNNAANFVPSLYDASKAPRLYTKAKVGGKNVVIDPLTGQQVSSTYYGLMVPGTGDLKNGILVAGTPGYPKAMVYGNGVLLAPRFGLSWDPFGDGKTAVRLGGGIFANPRNDAGALGNLFFNPPIIYDPTSYYGYVSQASNTSGLLSPPSFSRTLDMHGKTIRAYHMHFGVQRELPFKTVLDVSYVGSLGRHLGEVVQLNDVPYGAQFLPKNLDPTSSSNAALSDNFFRPYPGYSGIPRQIFEGNSSYHSLQVQANRRFAQGIQFGVAYTYSKAMGYTDGDSTSTSGQTSGSNEVATYLDRRVYNYGVTTYDRPQVLTFNFVYDLPRLSRLVPNPVVKTLFDGWQVTDITSFVPGSMRPVSVSLSASTATIKSNIVGGGQDWRPILMWDPNLPSGARTVDMYFNTSVFMMPIPLTPGQTSYSPTWLNYGNAPRLVVRGPGRNNWNISVRKNIKIRERMNLQLRAEAYNAFNHTQFSSMNTSLKFDTDPNSATYRQNINGSFGQITDSRDPRIMQLVLRISF